MFSLRFMPQSGFILIIMITITIKITIIIMIIILNDKQFNRMTYQRIERCYQRGPVKEIIVKIK